MATYTTNYNLEKPDASDDFGDFRASYNSNMDIIDQNLGGGGGGGDTVSWTQIQATGEKIAEITINGTTTDVLIPFEAKIIVTTTTGLTVTASKGGTTYTATETSTGVYEVSVDSKGAWTVTDGTNTTMVSVTAQTTYNVAFVVIPDGSTVTPTDDIQTWLNCANIWEKAYTTLAEVLADSTTLSALISDNNATDYLVRSTTWASGMCADSTAMTYIGLNNYCANKLLADATWRTAICNSTYFESVLNVKVPVMTSNTTPSGVAFASSEATAGGITYYAYRAFNGDISTPWASSEVSPTYCWIGYKFPTTKKIYKTVVRFTQNTTYYLQGSDDGITYTNIVSSGSATLNTNKEDFVNSEYQYFRYYNVAQISGRGQGCPLAQFYGREDV